ncbi:MAG: single-strand selective monofunctional uracil-DNA glycosylase [bacterium]|nr:single-strand selective monofunctional uracil-DNA glycosylase [bacterium]
MSIAEKLKEAAQTLSREVGSMRFSEPVSVVYNPLEYASQSHDLYLEKYADSKKQILFLGMNPGPWGMVQTGVPFGEIAAVRDWLGIETPVNKPANEHPKRLVEGFQCQKSEVSGRRLWGLFQERFGDAERFFAHHYVANYCPLVFMEESSRNRTPDKLKAAERKQLFALCDHHLLRVVEILEPKWLIGVGAFSEGRAQKVLESVDIKIGRILHPSPASPAANRDWAGTATKQLVELGIWPAE